MPREFGQANLRHFAIKFRRRMVVGDNRYLPATLLIAEDLDRIRAARPLSLISPSQVKQLTLQHMIVLGALALYHYPAVMELALVLPGFGTQRYGTIARANSMVLAA